MMGQMEFSVVVNVLASNIMVQAYSQVSVTKKFPAPDTTKQRDHERVSMEKAWRIMSNGRETEHIVNRRVSEGRRRTSSTSLRITRCGTGLSHLGGLVAGRGSIY